MLIGYARVSTSQQYIEAQIQSLKDAGCEKVFADHGVGGDRASRPEVDRLLEYLRSGNVLVVRALDRLARSLRLLFSMLDDLKERRVGIRTLREPLIDSTTASGELVIQISGVISEFERKRIRERIRAGLEHASKSGKLLGPPKALDDEKAPAIGRLRSQGTTVAELSRTFRISNPTAGKYL